MMRNEYCTNIKTISCELNGLCTKSRGRDASECMTYFNSTQFAELCYKIVAIME